MPRLLAGQSIVGNALDFDGSTSYAGRGFISSVQDNFTFSAWVNITNLPASNGYISTNGASNANGMSLAITSTGLFKGEYHFVANINSASTLTPGVWYNVAIVRDSGTTQCYVNGVASGSTSASTPNSPGSFFTVGATRPSGGTAESFLDALIDDVRFYERALTAAQVLKIYNVGLDASLTDVSVANLKIWAKLDETSGSATDSSGNSNTLTLTNSPSYVTGVVQISNIPARSTAGARTTAGTRTLATI